MEELKTRRYKAKTIAIDGGLIWKKKSVILS